MLKNFTIKIYFQVVVILLISIIGTSVGSAKPEYSIVESSARFSEEAQFVATVSGTSISFDWSAMVEANDYTMAVALSDANGDIDMGSLALLDMGIQKTFSTSGLPSGVIFYAAILADIDQGLVISNTAEFMPFAGTVTFPMDGGVLMQIDDLGGIGTITVSGTVNTAEDTMTISQISGDAGFGPFVLTLVDDKPATYTKGDLTIYFTYAADGTVTVQSVRNKVRSARTDPSEAVDWDSLNNCQKSIRWEMYDLRERFYVEADQIIIIGKTLYLLAEIVSNQFVYIDTHHNSDVRAEYYSKLYFIIKGFIAIYNDAAMAMKEKFDEDQEKLEEEYYACLDVPNSIDIARGSWSIVNNHELGDFPWYTLRFLGSTTVGSVQVLENNTASGSYEVNGAELHFSFTLSISSNGGTVQEEEYEGTFLDADTMQGTWRKRWPYEKDNEWVTGNWTGTRNN